MPNWHNIAAGAIGVVNPFVTGTIQRSTGSTTNADYSKTPTYTTFADVPMQVQALSTEDLQQLDGTNQNGTNRAVYMNGRSDGVVRSQLLGGDLITLTDGPNAGTWLVTKVPEQWGEWNHAIITLQQDPS